MAAHSSESTNAEEADERTDGLSASFPRFKGIDKPTPLFAQVASQLIRAIQIGEFPVGSRLPGEQELAKAFKVSRASIREALSCLQFEGYLEPRQGSGTIVISSVERGSRSLISTEGIRTYDPLDVMEARLELEPFVIALAAEDPLASELRNVKRILEGMELALSEPEMRAHSDLVFHTTLIRVCRNKALVDAAERLLNLGEDAVFRSARDRAWINAPLLKQWYIHHETMAHAISDRNPDQAKDACTAHLISVLKNMNSSSNLPNSSKARIATLIRKSDSTYTD